MMQYTSRLVYWLPCPQKYGFSNETEKFDLFGGSGVWDYFGTSASDGVKRYSVPNPRVQWLHSSDTNPLRVAPVKA